MKQARKNLSINIEYNSPSDLARILKDIAREVKNGNQYDRQMTDGIIVEFAVDKVEPDHYEEVFLNGRWCFVYQSKMNKPKKL